MYVRKMREVCETISDRYIIIDTHGGEEDILAIAVALRLAPSFGKIILGITCVNGRRTVEGAAHDALLAQIIAGNPQVPVYLGIFKST